MRGLVVGVAAVAVVIGAASGEAAERRCGWVENPTPGNLYLRDHDAEWVISEMGLYQAPGYDDMPDMSKAGWVKTNVEYGYGCGCLVVEVDRAARRVTRVVSAEPLPLRRCRADRGLPRP